MKIIVTNDGQRSTYRYKGNTLTSAEIKEYYNDAIMIYKGKSYTVQELVGY